MLEGEGRSGNRRREPRSLVRPMDDFGRTPQANVRLDLRVGAPVHELAAAAYAHLLSLRTAKAVGAAGMSHGRAAFVFGVSDEHLSRWLRGARWPTVLDVGRVVARFGTVAVPDPSEVDAMLRRARADMESVADSSGTARPVRQSREQVMALTALGLPPFVVVHEPYDDVESAALDALPGAAEGPLASAGRGLWARLPSVSPGGRSAAEGLRSLDVRVDLARPRYLDWVRWRGWSAGRSWTLPST